MTLRASISSAEETRMLLGTGKWMFRVRVKRRTDVAWTDLSNTAGGDWVVGISADIDTPDTPVAQFSVRFIRSADGHSLSPGMSASDLNQDATSTFSPLVFAGRLIDVAAYCATLAETRADAVWHPWLVGEVQSVSFADDVVAQCVTLDAALQRLQIEEVEQRGADDPGVPIADEIQGLLDRWDAGVTLLVDPSAPTFGVGLYETATGSLGDFLLATARRAAGDVRYRWDDASGEFRYTLYMPPREKVDPDLNLPASQVFDVPGLEVSREQVRNRFTLTYPDRSTGKAETRTLENTPSRDEYGPAWMGLVEDQGSSVDTAAKADALLGYASNDLGQPPTERRIRMPFMPFLALHHMIRVQPDGKRFDYATDYSVVGGSHEVNADTGAETSPMLRGGSPVGMYYSWRSRGGTVGVPDTEIYNVAFDDTAETATHFALVWEAAPGMEVWGAAVVFTGQPDVLKWDTTSGAVEPVALPLMVPKPSAALDEVTLVQLESRYYYAPTGEVRPGSIWRKPVYPHPVENPQVRADSVETGTSLTFWLGLYEFGLGTSEVEFRYNLSDAGWTAWEPPTRSTGDASTVKGGTLAALEYEYDADLAPRGFTKIQYRYLLDSGELVTSVPVSFDRDRVPTLIDVSVTGQVVAVIADFNDTLSVALEQVGGPWRREADGYSIRWDVSLPDASGNPGVGAVRQIYRAYAYAKPLAIVDGSTLNDYRDVTVVGSGAPVEPAWTPDTAVVAPTSPSGYVTLSMQASLAPVGYTVEVVETHHGAVGGWTTEAAITGSLSPALTAPPTTLTDYTFSTPFPAASGETSSLVEYVFTLRIKNGSGGVVDTRDFSVGWYY